MPVWLSFLKDYQAPRPFVDFKALNKYVMDITIDCFVIETFFSRRGFPASRGKKLPITLPD
jgi:hypothetical protein